MKALKAITAISDLAASQRGLFTSAQAQALGVGRVTLSRLAEHGQIERIHHGVYRAAGAPPVREEDVLAAWLSLEPGAPSYERDKGPGGFVASLNTASWLLGIGELNPGPITFSHPTRRQTRKDGIRFLKRELSPADVTVAGGIPVTTAARTMGDLVAYGEDLSLVSRVLRDALAAGLVDDEQSLRTRVNKYAGKRGLGAGFPLYDRLKEMR